MSGKAEGVFIARRSRVQQENNKNPAFGSLRTDRSCTKFTVPKMSTTKGVKFQDTGDGQHTDVLWNKTAQAPAQHGVFGLSQPGTPPQPSHTHSHRDTPVTLTISNLKPYRQPSPIAEEGGDWDIHRRSTDVDQIMPYTYSNSVLWNSWISDFNDDDDSSDEPQTETTIIQDIYIDPLDQCMEGIEDLATGILRTGKLGLQGEPGDMTKIQPVMFGLEPLAKDMPQLLPQLLTVPLFHQVDQDTYCVFDDDTPLEDFLATGHIRLGVPIDTIIYCLLRGHCAKGAKQAEELIRTAQNIGFKLQRPQTTMHLSPPIIFSSALARKTSREKRGNGIWDRRTSDQPFDESDVVESSPLPPGLADSKTANMHSDSSVSSIPSTDRSRNNSSTQQQLSLEFSKIANTPSSSSVSTTYSTGKSRNTSSASILSSTTSSSSLTEEAAVHKREQSTLTPITEVQAELGDDDETKPQHREIASTKQQTRQRKSSRPLKRPVVRTVSNSSAEFSGDDHEEKKPVADKNQWNMRFLDNTMVVAMYGDTTYPLLMWNPKLKVDFQLSSLIGLLDGAITGIDSTKPAVTVKVTNDSPYRIGFSISVHRQSTVFQPHVLYPTKGLHVLEQEQSWEDSAEFYCNPKSKEINEYFVLDMFVSTLDGNASWNILRKYAVMKAHKSPSSAPGSRRGSSAPGSRRGSRRPSRKFTQFQMPGNFDQKEENLKLIISHGLQCVVKNKLEEAEIIFTQALHLPDFQRVPIKAFVYICLAIIANKRKKMGDTTSLIPVLTMFNGATQLVEVYESTPGVVKMPHMLQLVKQLKKELDIKKVISQCKHNRRRRPKLQEKSHEESDTLTPEGGTLYYNSTVITVPPDALKTPTKITISKPDKKQLDSMLQSTGWDNTVQIVTAMHLQCNMTADHFEKPITIQSSLPEPLFIGSKSVIRLLQSNYLRHWQDITDDLHSQVAVSGNQVHISTDRMGWLAVAQVQLDVSKIAQMAMKSLSIDPIILRFSVYSQTYPDDVIQIAVFVEPCKANGEPLHQEDLKPQHHVPIAFPHTVQAWPGEKLQLALQGNFAPDASAGQKDLNYEFEVQQIHNRICEKWVKLTSESDQLLSGKLTVSRFCRREDEVWESITEMNLSNRNGRYSPESSSSDTHQY